MTQTDRHVQRSQAGVGDLVTTISYTAAGERTSIAQSFPGGASQRQMTYDTLGRMVAQTEPNTGTWQYAYNDSGDVVGLMDPRGCGTRVPLSQKITALVEHAVSPTANENEARNAAMQVCAFLKRHPEILSGASLDVDDADVVPQPYKRTGKKSEIHPKARAFLEWEEFKRAHGISLVRAQRYSLCLACGDEFQKGEAVLQQAQIGFTHARCGEWWRDYDFAGVQLPQDDDIPF